MGYGREVYRISHSLVGIPTVFWRGGNLLGAGWEWDGATGTQAEACATKSGHGMPVSLLRLAMAGYESKAKATG